MLVHVTAPTEFSVYALQKAASPVVGVVTHATFLERSGVEKAVPISL